MIRLVEACGRRGASRRIASAFTPVSLRRPRRIAAKSQPIEQSLARSAQVVGSLCSPVPAVPSNELRCKESTDADGDSTLSGILCNSGRAMEGSESTSSKRCASLTERVESAAGGNGCCMLPAGGEIAEHEMRCKTLCEIWLIFFTT